MPITERLWQGSLNCCHYGWGGLVAKEQRGFGTHSHSIEYDPLALRELGSGSAAEVEAAAAGCS